MTPDNLAETPSKPLLWKLFPVLFFNSAFAFACAGTLIREIATRCGGAEPVAYLIPSLLFLLFSAASGIPGYLLRNCKNISWCAFPAMLPVLLASAILPIPGSAWGIFLLLTALPVFFSAVNLHFLAKTAAGKNIGGLFAVHHTGAAFSAVLLTLFVHSPADMENLLLITGGLFLISLSAFYMPRLRDLPQRILLFLLAAAVLILLTWTNFRISDLSRTADAGKPAVRIETPNGRTELQPLPNRRFLLKNNGLNVMELPANHAEDLLRALETAIQPEKKQIRVMLVCNEFSGLPRAFSSMPICVSTEAAVRNQELLKLSQDLGIMPKESEKFKTAAADPVRFLSSALEQEYDLIFVEAPLPCSLDADRLFSEEFYKSAARHLADGGAFAVSLPVPPGYTRESIAELHGIIAATMRKVFPKVIFLPGASPIAVGGGGYITGDLDTLDARAENLLAESDFMPEGLLVVLHSQVEQQAQTERIIGRSIVSTPNQLFTAPLVLSFWRGHPIFTEHPAAAFLLRVCDLALFHWKWILGILLAFYLVLRYFISGPVPRKCIFLSLENGFFQGGLITTLLFHFQTENGTLYRMFGICAGLLCAGLALGVCLPHPLRKWETALRRLSLLLPLISAAELLYGGSRLSVICIILFFAGISCGTVAEGIFRKLDPEKQHSLLWSLELAGCAAGVLLASLLMIADRGFAVMLLLLLLSRANILQKRT